jgi:hypothetical protein
MNTLSLVLLAALASAQNRAAEIDFQNQLDSLRAEQKKVSDNSAAVESALTAMNDGPLVGGEVVDAIRSRKLTVVYAPLTGGVVISEKTPRQNAAIAPVLARAAAEIVFAGMPDCAEKNYMIQSWEARSWIEMYGDPKTLPAIAPGYEDKELAARITQWLGRGNREMALELISKATKTKIIPDLEADASTAAEKATLAEANKRFTEFLWIERGWLQTYGLR